MIYQMSPFFEVYARHSCGASSITVGFIFAAMPASCFVASLVMDGMIRSFGVEAMMTSGLILSAASALGFGLSKSVVGWLCWRAVQGVALAPIYTSISTRMALSFTGEEFHRVVGLQEVCDNVGLIVGPLLGGMLFQYGGFALPFITSAALHLMFVGIFVIALLCRRAETNDAGDADVPSSVAEEVGTQQSEPPHVTICSVARVRLLLLAGISTLCSGVFGAFEPLLGHWKLS
eukprot:Skav206284  [mRNA]  locus=scaffold922:226757:227675:- [translate_table: standard]